MGAGFPPYFQSRNMGATVTGRGAADCVSTCALVRDRIGKGAYLILQFTLNC